MPVGRRGNILRNAEPTSRADLPRCRPSFMIGVLVVDGGRFRALQAHLVPFNLIVVRPFQDRLAGELGASIRDCASRFAIERGQRIQFACQSGACVDNFSGQL